MHRMQTRTDSIAPSLNWLDPFGSWETAARWNAIASEWMTKGWQQWLQLATVWPALEAPAPGARAVIPAQAGTQEARDAREVEAQAAEAMDSRLRGNDASRRAHAGRKAERPAAKAAAKRPAAKRPARPQAAARSSRTRG